VKRENQTYAAQLQIIPTDTIWYHRYTVTYFNSASVKSYVWYHHTFERLTKVILIRHASYHSGTILQYFYHLQYKEILKTRMHEPHLTR